ncbi:nucleoside triphosphate pyrophosphohydrolase [Halobacillus sp. A5]|uniref:nucleoside triphosphate pyrophosphohydrolase n=1 Tax=Halobacillus sp. A5 TaxID=2880263 RepID=UPI0020A643C1|nr:nucleoside triphosphate pyrophosphohydrolase [Halobacillus sp. A5]MCP3028603.1 nucleoside triphosphate pyrophosphohydrolase [Halobacillus sp. A5]
MPIYNKLVRDRIPEIIEKSEKSYETKILDQDEYIKSLKIKLQEELQEYLTSENDQEAAEELADLLEIIYVLSKIHGSSIKQVEEIRRQKADERGSFNEKIFLKSVED